MRQSAQDTPSGAARSSMERSELALPSARHAPARTVHFGPRSELSVRLKSSLNRTPACGGGPASGKPASGVPASGVPASGGPASGGPASGGPASARPASGNPASGVPASGTPPSAGGGGGNGPAFGGGANTRATLP